MIGTNMKRWWALSVFGLTCFAQSLDLDQKISEAMENALKQTGAPSVSVALIKDGKVIFAKAAGKASVQPERLADAATRYAVGSISKQFTAAAILLSAERHKLSLDDKVSKYFPELTRAGEITIRELLSHTSGYEDYAPQDYVIPEWLQPTSPRAILDRWAKKPLNFDPGTRWQYSNTNYVLAGEIFEKASGEHLVDFLRAKIFDPLGMRSAGDCVEGNPVDATAYTRFALGPPRPVAREASGWYFAAGELCMTPSDLAKWDLAFLGRKILSPRSYEEFTREVRLSNGDLTHYALGLDVSSVRNVPRISHGGEVSGFLALNAVFPTRNAAVITLSNQDGVSFLGSLSDQIATLVLFPQTPAPAASEKEIKETRQILEGLQRSEINRTLFTENANSYFTTTSLEDFKSSLTPLGPVKSITRLSEALRGGMTHRYYRAQFETKAAILNIYVMPDGKYEQFLVMEQP
jgi:CubicO group peptidase (beta-lactamase class C family)